jgi:predicted RNase H-like HicB family nuclease
MLFHVTMEKDEDGYVVTECPALPGCVVSAPMTPSVHP